MDDDRIVLATCSTRWMFRSSTAVRCRHLRTRHSARDVDAALPFRHERAAKTLSHRRA